MGTVVALEEFRQTLGEKKPAREKLSRPSIRGGEIWGRDYTEIEAIVFGLLKIRDIVAYHVGTQDQTFDQLCLDALTAAYRVEEQGTRKLKMAVTPLKEWVLDAMTEDNKRDMSWALVLADLIEKSPTK